MAQSDKGGEEQEDRVISHGRYPNPGKIYSRAEIDEMLSKVGVMKQELEKKFNNLYSLAREKKIDIDKLYGDIRNLTLPEMQELAHRERELIDKLKKAIPPESCIPQIEKSSKELTNERKKKFLPSRKKWLQM